MGDVIAALAVVLVLSVWVVILVMMFRASKAQRARMKRKDFGGRYSDFGLLLVMLRGTGRKRDEGKVPPEASSADRDDRSR